MFHVITAGRSQWSLAGGPSILPTISGIRLCTTGLTTGIKNLITGPNSTLRNPPFCKISLLFETRVFFFDSASMSFACHFSIENWWSVSGIFPFNRFAAIYDIESHICREQRLMAPLLVSSFASSEHFIINKGCPWASCLVWSSTLTSYISFPGYIQSKFLTANTHLTISREHALLSD